MQGATGPTMASDAKGEGIRNLDEQLCFAVYSTAHAFNRLYRPFLTELGLTYPQFLAMLVLWERDGQTVTAIGDRLMLDSGTLTPLLKRLEVSGLIARARSRDDERRVLVHLTAEGRALRGKAGAARNAVPCAVEDSGVEKERLLADVLSLRGALRRAIEAEG